MRKLITLMIAFICCIGMWAEEHYLVGGCTDSKWEEGETVRSAVRAYTSDGITWVWAGNLTVTDDPDDNNGRFKIPNTVNGWDGIWAKTKNQLLTTAWADYSTDNTGNTDYKFRVGSGGYYLITFNTSTKQIKAEKLTTEPSKVGDYYLISSVNDYYWFAAFIASDGNRNAKAKLTADLDFSGKTFIPLASEKYKFSGEFDGNCKKIKNVSIKSITYNNIGLFCMTDGANIHDVEFVNAKVNITKGQNTGLIVGTCDNSTTISKCAVVNSYLTAYDHTGSIAGCVKGGSTISNCFSNASISSNYQAGGMVGTSNGDVTLSHCIFMGPNVDTTKDTAAGLISRLESGNATLTYNLVATQHIFSQEGESKALTRVSGGTLQTKEHNYSWNTTLYGNSTSNSTYSLDYHYDNNGAQKSPSEINKVFFESTLGFDFESTWEMVTGKTYLEGSYPILKGMSIPDDIAISSSEELIDFSTFMWDNTNAILQNDIDLTDKEFKPIGWNYTTKIKYYGTFNGNNHSIKNLNIDTDKSYIGLFGYLKGGANISNLIIDSSCSFKGASKVGGIAGMADGGGTVTLNNVINAATIEATGSKDANAAGFIACCINSTLVAASNCVNRGNVSNSNCNECGAFTGWSQSGSTYSYCINTAIISNMDIDKTSGKNNNLYRGTATLTNCFDISKSENRGQGLCLNVDEDDVVLISSPTDLSNFSSVVNLRETNLNAKLTQDIDMSSISYTPIGTSTNKYTGTFDGQNHSVTLNINTPDESRVGFIAYAYATSEKHAHIKNLTIKGEVKGDSYVAGIIGSLSGTGGEIIFENCGNEANIDATHINAGGIFGCSFDGSVRVRMINCYNAGDIKSEKESGQLTGWSTNTEITNCYTIGDCTNCDNFARLGPGTNNIKNCYSDHNLTWDNHPTYVTAEQIENGVLCAKLGYGFRQNLSGEEKDDYPNFNVEHGFVNQIGAAGYSTQYNAMSDVTIPADVEAFAGEKNGSLVRLVPVEGKIKAGVPVVLKASPGLYNFMPTTGAAAPAKNDLRGSDGSVPFGENIYVLANKSHGIGFYKTEDNGKNVPEGRAYIDNSGSSVKEAYLFSFDDEETAIANVNGNENGNNAAIYNMAGQRISKLQKGINIVNGKKVLF